MLFAEEVGEESDPNPARGSFVVTDRRVDVIVEIAGTPKPTRYLGNGIPIGSRGVALEGPPRALLSIAAIPRRHLLILATDVPAQAIAREIARGSGARIDGIQRVVGTRVSLNFKAIQLVEALAILADVSDLALLRNGDAHFAFSTTLQHRELLELAAAVETAEDNKDRAALDAALQPLLEFVKPKAKEPALLDYEYWIRAAGLATERGDLAGAERLWRELVRHIERIEGGPVGADYGRALYFLASVRLLRGDEVEFTALLERGLEIAEAELGEVDAALVFMQMKLAGQRAKARRDDEAEVLFERAIEGLSEADEDPLNVIRLKISLRGLANVYLENARLAEAQPLLERRLLLLRSDPDSGAAEITDASQELASVMYARDLLTQSAALMQRPETVGDADSSVAQELRERLKVIRALGAYAADTPVGDAALPVLRATLARGQDQATLIEMMRVLDRRAERQHRESPSGPAWRATCEAFAETNAHEGSQKPTAASRQLGLDSCLLRRRSEEVPRRN